MFSIAIKLKGKEKRKKCPLQRKGFYEKKWVNEWNEWKLKGNNIKLQRFRYLLQSYIHAGNLDLDLLPRPASRIDKGQYVRWGLGLKIVWLENFFPWGESEYFSTVNIS